MKEEFKACFVSNTHKASFELLFHASVVTARSWPFVWKCRKPSFLKKPGFFCFHASFVTFMSWPFIWKSVYQLTGRCKLYFSRARKQYIKFYIFQNDALQNNKIAADISMLCQTLGTQSRMSVFRRLKEIGYPSGYTHADRYYTLRNLPQFDDGGLWFHRGIGFSVFITLRNTVIEAVKSSVNGMSRRIIYCV